MVLPFFSERINEYEINIFKFSIWKKNKYEALLKKWPRGRIPILKNSKKFSFKFLSRFFKFLLSFIQDSFKFLSSFLQVSFKFLSRFPQILFSKFQFSYAFLNFQMYIQVSLRFIIFWQVSSLFPPQQLSYIKDHFAGSKSKTLTHRCFIRKFYKEWLWGQADFWEKSPEICLNSLIFQ